MTTIHQAPAAQVVFAKKAQELAQRAPKRSTVPLSTHRVAKSKPRTARRVRRTASGDGGSGDDDDSAKPTKHHLDQRADLIIAEGMLDGPDDMLLTTPQTALWLGVSTQFLEAGRSAGYGPPYVSLAPRVVRYRKDEVNAWLRERSVANVKARRAKLGEG